MNQRIYSLETEYALTHLPAEGESARPPEELFRALAEAVDPELKPPDSNGKLMFLANGAKFYDDNGHPEWACPECRSVTDAVIWDKAGEYLLGRIGAEAEERLGGRVLIAKNNVDLHGNFYGCHENYLVERKPAFLRSEGDFLLLLVRHLVPFLVTRQIYTGAGKVGWFQSAKEPTFGYQISQRAEAVGRVVSEETRSDRAIINTRDEALADSTRYRRLHLIVGDSTLSQWATFMKLGTTGIVLRLIEENFIDDDLALANPMVAIREVSYDPTCQRPVALKSGEQQTAIDIQYRYLAMAEAYFECIEMDAETQFVLTQWRGALEKLAQDPDGLADRVDWISKKHLLERQIERNGYQWQDPQVRELDIKYHDLHQQRGLFYQLEQSGAVSVFLEALDIERAMFEPPSDTRAKIRCNCIRAAHRWRMPLTVEWDEIKLGRHTISLGDPLEFFDTQVDTLLADGQTLGFLEEMLTQLNADVRKRAVRALGQLEGDKPLEILAQALLDDPDWSVRASAIEALKTRPSHQIEDLVMGALQDSYFVVRTRAATVLRGLR